MAKLLWIFVGTGLVWSQAHAQVQSPQSVTGDGPISELNGGEDVGEPSRDHRLIDIAKRMQFVHSQLQKNEITASTREAQRQIAKQLKALLDSSAPQPPPGGENSSDQSQNDRQQPQNNSTQIAPDQNPQTSGAAELAQLRASLIEQAWGNLPPRMRDELRAVRADEFLPQYETLIEKYFRRLAERRPK